MNPWPPIEPIDEKMYNIRLNDGKGTIYPHVEYWAFGGGFLLRLPHVRPEGCGDRNVDFKLSEITGFEEVK